MPTLALLGGAHIHTPSFVKKMAPGSTPDTSTRYVYDPDPDTARHRAQVCGGQVIDDPAVALKDKAVDAVVICSQTVRHADLVLAAAKARKHMFVEKPLGMGAADAFRMAKAIDKAGVIFQTGYFLRSRGDIRFLRDAIRAGKLGKITRVRLSNCHGGTLNGWFDTQWRWMADPALAGCGAFGDLGAHVLDLLLWMLEGDEVADATAHLHTAIARYGDTDEYGEGLVRFASGAVASLAAGWADVANPNLLEVAGTQGHANIHHNQLFVVSQNIDGADGRQPFTDLPADAPHAFDLFLAAIAGQPTAIPLTSAAQAARDNAVMQALYEGAAKKRWIAPKRPGTKS